MRLTIPSAVSLHLVGIYVVVRARLEAQGSRKFPYCCYGD